MWPASTERLRAPSSPVMRSVTSEAGGPEGVIARGDPDAPHAEVELHGDRVVPDAGQHAAVAGEDPGVIEGHGDLPAVIELVHGHGGRMQVRHDRGAGERVVFIREGEIILAHGDQEMPLLPLESLKPAKAAQPEMVMAAVAAAWALDIPPELIAAGLHTFESNHKKTPY